MSDTTPIMHLVRPSVTAPAAPSSSAACHIKIQTSALFQILEIVSKQVLDSNKRIIGTLLGVRSDDGSEYEIRDAFMVPCDETGESIAIEDHTHKTLYQLYKKAHPKEYVLGWFGSSNTIDTTTSLIHDFYSKGSDRAFPFPAIHLNLQYMSEDSKLHLPKITTYVGAAIGRNPANAQKITWKTNTTINSYIFTPVPNKIIESSATERLSLNLLKEKSINTNSISLESDLSFLSNQLNSISSNIDKLLAHIESPTDSDEFTDLLRLLTNQLLTDPQASTNLDELKKHFHDHNQDVIMIEYLTKAVKEQIELSARLTASAEADKKC